VDYASVTSIIYTVDRVVTFLFYGVINKLQSRLCRVHGYYACGWCGHCSV